MSEFAPETNKEFRKRFEELLYGDDPNVRALALALITNFPAGTYKSRSVATIHKSMVSTLVAMAKVVIATDPRRVKLLASLGTLDEMGSELDADERYQEILQELWDINTTMSRQDYATFAVAVGDDDDLWPCTELAQELIDTYKDEQS